MNSFAADGRVGRPDGGGDVGLEVVRASRPELLLDTLAERLSRRTDDPLVPHVVAVPTRAVRDWLNGELARRLGVVAGVRFLLPTELVAETLGLDRDATDPWASEHLAWHVLAAVDGAGAAAIPGAPWDGRPDRPLTLARHLADRFESYGVLRPDLLVAWAAGRDTDGGGPDAAPLRADLAWQAELWRTVRAAIGAASPAERLVAALAEGPEAFAAAGPLTLFGPWALSGSGVELVARVAEVRDTALLVAVPRALDHPLVVRWGAGAIEAIGLLDGLRARLDHVEVREVPDPDPAGPPDQLAGLHAELGRAPQDGAPRRVALPGDAESRVTDGSVRVHACSGLVRQLEVLRDALLHEFRADPELRPRDVLVLCPDPALVAPLVEPVLGADVAGVRLPVALVDRSDLRSPAVHDAMDRLLALASGRMDRDEVDTLLDLDAVRVACDLDDDDLAFLTTAAERLGVRWGVDGAHRARWGYDPARDEDTWAPFLDRLVAGVLHAPDRGRVVPTPTGRIAPADHLVDPEEARVGRVSIALRRLMRVARLGDAPRDALAWGVELRGVVERLLVPPTRTDDDSRAFHLQARQVLAVVDAIAEDARTAGAEGVQLDVRELRTVVRERLADRGRSDQPPGPDRIAVGGLLVGRGVPARVVALVGLDEVALRPPTVDADDVVAATRRVGEPDRTLTMRAALLDAVQSAQRIVITCDGQNVVTGERLPLATVVEELCDALPELAERPDDDLPLVVRHPRHLADRRNVGLDVDEVRAVRAPGAPAWTFQPIALRTIRRIEEVGLHTLGGEARWVVQEGDGWRLRVPDGPADPGLVVRDLPGAEAASPGAPVRASLDIDRVASAFREPANAFVRARLGVHLPDELALAPRNLELWVDGRREAALGGEALEHLRLGGAVDDWVEARMLQGGLPPGAVGRRLLERIAEEAAAVDAAAGAPRGEPDARTVATSVDVDGSALVLTAAVGERAGTALDVRFVKDHGREPVTTWLRLLVAAAAGDPVDGALLVRRGGKGVPAVRRLAVAGDDAAARAEVAREVLPVLVDLALRVRSAPVPLFGRTSWSMVAGETGKKPIETDLGYDTGSPAGRLVFGPLRPLDLERQLPGPTEDDLPEGPNPAARWVLALRELVEHSLVMEQVTEAAA